MNFASPSTAIPTDSPEARNYNRIRRWVGLADFGAGLLLLLVLLATGWTGTLRDLALNMSSHSYTLGVFFYVAMLLLLGKLVGIGLDYYSFRVERRFQLSNQRFRSWLWDQAKGFLLGLVLASIIVELLYFIIRQFPQTWWLITWAAFLLLFVLLAQLAPVILFPIFYKFEPLDNEDLKA